MERRKKGMAVLVAILLTGCGGEEVTSAPQQDSPPPAQDRPSALLLGEDDLPPGLAKTESIPEPCSPVPVLEGQGATVATSPLYNLRTKYVAEAVGIAPSTEKAAMALSELQDEERLACIKSTIETFGPQEGDSVTSETPVPVAEGEEGSMALFLEVDASSKPINSTVAVSFRTGRCVATLLFLLRGSDSGRPFIDNLTGRAYDSLADAQAACR